jgi:predicted AAA+ superfamily ATPase
LITSTDKFKEKVTTKDIVGLENCCYVLNKWYNDSLLDLNSKLLLIIGPTGCGKTLLVETYCQEENISLYTVKFNAVKTKKEMLKDIFNFIEYDSCSFFSKSENQERKLILIDEYQNGQNDLLSISDINNFMALRTNAKSKDLQTFVSGIVNINSIPKIPPILIIGNNSKGTKLSDLKKSSEVYYINELNLRNKLIYLRNLN